MGILNEYAGFCTAFFKQKILFVGNILQEFKKVFFKKAQH